MKVFLFLVSLICLIVGLAKPSKMIFWKQEQYRTRKNVLKYFGTVTIIFVILIGIFSPSSSTKTNANVTSNKTDVIKNADSDNKDEQSKEVKKLGWTRENGNWYYYDNNGKEQTGWLNDNNKYYYLSSSGITQKGWIKDNGKDYYLDNSGVM